MLWERMRLRLAFAEWRTAALDQRGSGPPEGTRRVFLAATVEGAASDAPQDEHDSDSQPHRQHCLAAKVGQEAEQFQEDASGIFDPTAPLRAKHLRASDVEVEPIRAPEKVFCINGAALVDWCCNAGMAVVWVLIFFGLMGPHICVSTAVTFSRLATCACHRQRVVLDWFLSAAFNYERLGRARLAIVIGLKATLLDPVRRICSRLCAAMPGITTVSASPACCFGMQSHASGDIGAGTEANSRVLKKQGQDTLATRRKLRTVKSAHRMLAQAAKGGG